MKEMWMVDDLGVGNIHGHTVRVPTIKMTCDCGWVEKANADRDARARAENHMQNRHNGGVIHYKGNSIFI